MKFLSLFLLSFLAAGASVYPSPEERLYNFCWGRGEFLDNSLRVSLDGSFLIDDARNQIIVRYQDGSAALYDIVSDTYSFLYRPGESRIVAQKIKGATPLGAPHDMSLEIWLPFTHAYGSFSASMGFAVNEEGPVQLIHHDMDCRLVQPR